MRVEQVTHLLQMIVVFYQNWKMEISFGRKGFPGIKVPCGNKYSILVMPPFLYNGRFSENELIETYNMASKAISNAFCLVRIKFNKSNKHL